MRDLSRLALDTHRRRRWESKSKWCVNSFHSEQLKPLLVGEIFQFSRLFPPIFTECSVTAVPWKCHRAVSEELGIQLDMQTEKLLIHIALSPMPIPIRFSASSRCTAVSTSLCSWCSYNVMRDIKVAINGPPARLSPTVPSPIRFMT